MFCAPQALIFNAMPSSAFVYCFILLTFDWADDTAVYRRGLVALFIIRMCYIRAFHISMLSARLLHRES
jgi:hypothetical protein